ncbi:MAG: hypothetical protein RIR26_2271 [Pseudomonadota bacterium]|jgi:hypothetical protein
MAFWAKKKSDSSGKTKDSPTNSLLKKKDDKKGPPPKRIDNLRIAQKLHVSLRSLGTGNEYHFLTKDLSATGMFVLCSDQKRYPFLPQSTILETTVWLKADEHSEGQELHCLCKIARIVEGTAHSASGFGVRIVQISNEQRHTLEHFIATHGSPENLVPYVSGASPEPTPDLTPHSPLEAQASAETTTETGEIGTDTPPDDFSHTA